MNKLDIDYTVATLCVVGSLVTMILNATSPIATALRDGKRLTGVLIGSDYEDYARHSDTMMLSSYDPQGRFLDVMSVPRDTMVSVPGAPAIRRANEVFTYEFRRSKRDFHAASQAVANTIETLVSSGSLQTISIPHYFTVDYSGFRAMVDAMGGISVRVTEPMHYDDNWGKLHIHFDPGVYWMNGTDALRYVRFRGSSADQGRILRQQLFLKEFLKRFKNPRVWWSIPKQAEIIFKGVHTNIQFWDLTLLLLEAVHLKNENIRLLSLPGAPSGNLWKIDSENTQRILQLMHAPVVVEEPETADAAGVKSVRLRAPTVEIWNASDYPNLARAMVYLLRSQGFDVVKFGPFQKRQTRTLVVDRSGKLRPAQSVAEVLKIANPDVISRVDKLAGVDVWVILGNDYPIQKDRRLKL